MKQVTKHIEQSINEVKKSFPSIFSKDDVINLLVELSETIEKDDDVSNCGTFDKEVLMEKIKEGVENALENMSSKDFVDLSSCEFTIRNGNEIEIDDVGINTSDIVDEVMREVEEELDEMLEEQES